MFFRLRIFPKDQPTFRFLWRKDPANEVEKFQNANHNMESENLVNCGNHAFQRIGTDNQNDSRCRISVRNFFCVNDY